MKGFLPKRVLAPVRASMLLDEAGGEGPDLVDLSSPQKNPLPLAADFQTILQVRIKSSPPSAAYMRQ